MTLILVLVSSPALAAICATSCASESVMSSLHDDMSKMQHCHEDSKSKDTNKSDVEQKSCAMGAGCHFTQVVFPFDALSKYIYTDSSTVSFPKFVPSGKSTDLSPPLKPPA